MSDRGDCTQFGPFRLFPAERLLLKGDSLVAIGARELDLLIALVERAGEVVSKRELFARVWPGVVVEESSLRVQVAGLRRVLADGSGQARYIVNVAGRGYSFVGSVVATANATASARPSGGVPTRRPSRIIGRDPDIELIAELLAEHRFVTLHGPGGVGKTTLAAAVAGLQSDAAVDGVYFVDLSLNAGVHTAADALASALGLTIRASDPTDNVLDFIRSRQMLLVLDSCEAMVDAAAALAAHVIGETRGVAVLATSREPLRARGEHVYPLAPLKAPPANAALKAAELLAFPAAQLFCERAAESGYLAEVAELGDTDAVIVGNICRRVDGNPLALELAASRVSTYGLRQTSVLLDSHMKLAWRGRRTAPPRHQTLNAMLDWSYALIGEPERALLRCLSVFVGAFTRDGACSVGDGGDEVVAVLEQLVQKSLVAADTSAESPRYRLLDATRQYARAKLVESGATAETSRRHAQFYLDWLARSAPAVPLEQVANARAALVWAFSGTGDSKIALALATQACELFQRLGMLTESRYWSERALEVLPPERAVSYDAMVLRAALAHALMFTGGDTNATRAALTSALTIAEQIDDPVHQFQMLSGLHMYHRRISAVDELLPIAKRAVTIAPLLSGPEPWTAAQAMLGVSHHIKGNLAEAHAALTAMRAAPADPNAMMNVYGFHRDAYALFGATLWMRGYPDQAAAAAHDAAGVDESKDPVTACLCLMWRVVVFHLSGDWPVAREYIERLVGVAGEHGLEPHKWFGVGLRGDGQVHCDEVDAGVSNLREALRRLKEGGYVIWVPWLTCCLAEALAAHRDLDQALSLVKELDLDPRARSDLYMPERLRVHGSISALAGDVAAAEHSFRASLELADVQGSLSWRLRAATNLARLRLAQGRAAEARETLTETYGRFTEGFETRDLRTARALLAEIDAARSALARA
ncbi:MAG TPA: winged helix-turn-helix domain-containing protein [Gammaproteobacteria bacterium]|nr:winged helix-turn-helix domain-containing protein [Gammaproteobacteria bacterium]